MITAAGNVQAAVGPRLSYFVKIIRFTSTVFPSTIKAQVLILWLGSVLAFAQQQTSRVDHL
jgi:hypothetical protein